MVCCVDPCFCDRYFNNLLFEDETTSVILGDLFLTVGSLAFIGLVMFMHTN